INSEISCITCKTTPVS
ncbi:unnamed protein product, partial [Allacma fusca]